MRLSIRGFSALVASCLLCFGSVTPASAAENTPSVPIVAARSFTEGVNRVGGSDRYAVSAAIANEAFVSTGITVYVASGATYPDALSGSAASSADRDGAVLLLVSRDSIPSGIEAQLLRIRPNKIVILGGEDSISAALEPALARFAPRVVRLAGTDRYDVSASLATVFPTTTRTAYIASGAGFADALSASAAAGKEKAPVLLVTKDDVPPSTITALSRFPGLQNIVVMGGEESVSDAVVARLSAIANTTRVSGRDRFEVSANVSAAKFGAGASTVFIASGEVFPDALSSACVAVPRAAPVLLVTKNAIPDAVALELSRLKPTVIVLLGGTETVSDGVFAKLRDYLHP